MRYIQFVGGQFKADIDDNDMPDGRPAHLADVPVRLGEAVYEINRDTPAVAAHDIASVTAGDCGGGGLARRVTPSCWRGR